MSRLRLPLLLVPLLSALGLACPAAAAPAVVASIKPVHSLVAAVMAGVGEPGLIVGGAASPHVYSLRPSDARRLEGARLVFWIGPIYEGFLMKPLAALAGKAEIVELDKAPGVGLLPAREGGSWEADEHDHGGAPHAGSALEQDGHLWLDPENARAILRIAVARLSAIDPGNAARYGANGAALERRLEALDQEMRTGLAAVRDMPFVVFHDAYQYLERHYGLAAIGSITVSPENRPGARRVQEIRAKLARLGARCVFSEPQFEPNLVQTVIAGTGAATGTLDPLGAAIPDGPELYFTVMTQLARSLTSCLARSS